MGAYGTRVENVLADVTRPDDLGLRFGADLTGAEVRYLMTKEWAQTAEAQRAGLAAQLEMVRASRWVKMGRTVGLGPEV